MIKNTQAAYKQKIAFIGGTGFIGHFSAQHALDRGHQVAIIHRGIHPCDLDKATIFNAERKDCLKINAFLQDWQPDVVVDTYAMTKQDAEFTVFAVNRLNLPIIVLSSQDVYAQWGSLHGHPCEQILDKIDENAPLTIPYPYKDILQEPDGNVYNKKDVEACLHQAFIDKKISALTILRLPAVYGPRDPQNRFKAIISLLNLEHPEILCKNNASWRWSHAHVKDVAHAIVLACEQINKCYEVFNVSENFVPTMQARFNNIATRLGKTIKWNNIHGDLPPELMVLGEFPNDLVTDDNKIRKTLGYRELTTIDERENDLINLYLNLAAPVQKINSL